MRDTDHTDKRSPRRRRGRPRFSGLATFRRGQPRSAQGPGSGGVTAAGILDSRILPDDEFGRLWDS